MTDQAKDATNTEDPPDFAVFLTKTNKGRTLKDLSARFAELVAAASETGKPGKLVLAIDVKPVKGTNGEQVQVTETVTVKVPAFDRPPSTFFVTEDGGLDRNPPRQDALFDTEDEEKTSR